MKPNQNPFTGFPCIHYESRVHPLAEIHVPGPNYLLILLCWWIQPLFKHWSSQSLRIKLFLWNCLYILHIRNMKSRILLVKLYSLVLASVLWPTRVSHVLDLSCVCSAVQELMYFQAQPSWWIIQQDVSTTNICIISKATVIIKLEWSYYIQTHVAYLYLLVKKIILYRQETGDRSTVGISEASPHRHNSREVSSLLDKDFLKCAIQMKQNQICNIFTWDTIYVGMYS